MPQNDTLAKCDKSPLNRASCLLTNVDELAPEESNSLLHVIGVPGGQLGKACLHSLHVHKNKNLRNKFVAQTYPHFLVKYLHEENFIPYENGYPNVISDHIIP